MGADELGELFRKRIGLNNYFRANGLFMEIGRYVF
jgi:hypothetical protein